MKPTSIAAGTALIGTLLVLAPAGAIQLNEALDDRVGRFLGGASRGRLRISAPKAVYPIRDARSRAPVRREACT